MAEGLYIDRHIDRDIDISDPVHYRVYLKCASAPLEEDNIFPSHCDTNTKTVQTAEKEYFNISRRRQKTGHYHFPQPKVYVDYLLNEKEEKIFDYWNI